MRPSCPAPRMPIFRCVICDAFRNNARGCAVIVRSHFSLRQQGNYVLLCFFFALRAKKEAPLMVEVPLCRRQSANRVSSKCEYIAYAMIRERERSGKEK